MENINSMKIAGGVSKIRQQILDLIYFYFILKWILNMKQLTAISVIQTAQNSNITYIRDQTV